MDMAEGRLETHGKVWNVVLEKDEEDELYRRVRNGEVLQRGEEYPTNNKRKAG